MSQSVRRVCVFCASSSACDPAYFEAAREVGSSLAREGLEVVRTYGDWMVPGLWYRALRKVVLRRTGKRLSKYPEPIWPFGALGRAWRGCFGRTRLSLYTTPTIGVIGRKAGGPA